MTWMMLPSRDSLLLHASMTCMMLLSPGLIHVACINGMNDAAIPAAHWCCVYQWHEWCCYPGGSHISLVSMTWMMLLSLWLTPVACSNDMNDATIPGAHSCCVYQWHEWCCYPCGSLMLRVSMTWMMLLSLWLTHFACINDMHDAAIPVAHSCCVYQWHEWCCYPWGSHMLLVTMTCMMLLYLGSFMLLVSMTWMMLLSMGLTHVAFINGMNDAVIYVAHSCCLYQWHEWCCYPWGSHVLLVSMTWMMLLSPGLTRVACINYLNDAAIPGAHSYCLYQWHAWCCSPGANSCWVYQWHEWCCYPWGSLLLLVSMTWMMLLSPWLTHVACINDMNDATISGAHSCCLYQWHEWCCYPRGLILVALSLTGMLLFVVRVTHQHRGWSWRSDVLLPSSIRQAA